MAEIFNGKYLGCCESLSSVSRRELINRVRDYPHEVNMNKGNLNLLTDYLNLAYQFIYRFPYKEELNDRWESEHENHDVILSVDPDIVGIPHKNFIQTTINGRVFNLPFCPSNIECAKIGVKKINHWKTDIRIYGEKYTQVAPNGYTLFECLTCGSVFSLNRSETIYIRKLLHHMGLTYEANLIKYKVTDELSIKAKELQEFANNIDNEGLTYTYEDSLLYIQQLEDKDDRDFSIDELKEILHENQFFGV
ncbi:hypothetical protein [Clostridium butyricum]|uniref:hypothetical protein n=1 Tax=Clostridium butyricum TaxID=1492 RepID=UPI002AB095E5|nr:hypothetical protein [Clostridium butyricum]